MERAERLLYRIRQEIQQTNSPSVVLVSQLSEAVEAVLDFFGKQTRREIREYPGIETALADLRPLCGRNSILIVDDV